MIPFSRNFVISNWLLRKFPKRVQSRCKLNVIIFHYVKNMAITSKAIPNTCKIFQSTSHLDITDLWLTNQCLSFFLSAWLAPKKISLYMIVCNYHMYCHVQFSSGLICSLRRKLTFLFAVAKRPIPSTNERIISRSISVITRSLSTALATADCSDLRSVTIHLQNYGPTSQTLKHGHMRCNDFWIESCFRVHSSKISKQVSKCLFQTQWSIYI